MFRRSNIFFFSGIPREKERHQILIQETHSLLTKEGVEEVLQEEMCTFLLQDNRMIHSVVVEEADLEVVLEEEAKEAEGKVLDNFWRDGEHWKPI